MSEETFTFTVDGFEVEATPGQTIIQACDAAGIYIPRLCHHPDLEPAGHCRVCTCKIDGRRSSACTMPATSGMVVESDIPELNEDRRVLIEMLFVEGNHFCPSCEKSGDCELQALGYRLGMTGPTLPYLWPDRDLDATHPDIFIDRNRCILCSRCIRASRLVDGKSVFGFDGRGIHLSLNIDADHLDETTLEAADKGAQVCPVGCIVIKRTGYHVPYGERAFDRKPIGSEIEAHKRRRR
ncbi:NAD-reducing hydrogenase HoxS subunit gamma [Hartmannibacter diazotrophicus]|uniref:NAD-reducing hydrogenase HoxS subunit gamma n=1 Tax=Hartmannibacter diazotrophicus TaxID=1482074 RepID=A0A2C9D2E4_9HYPH|nr:2Fe-2S iron-sulfur cluster-binding protein [Hartmannibacter diazotrophicus]SON53971.1 NAD-reducing hydrogenase HoxS subunit gamma [Hartmannibacter diazotrophicus]